MHPHQEPGLPGEPEPSDALGDAFETLGLAAARAAIAAAEVARSGDDLRALRCLAALDQSLAEIGRLAAAIPGVVQAAFPGVAVEIALREKQEAADRAAADVRRRRAQLEELTAAEERLRRTADEYEDLRRRVAELRRLERAAEVLPQLNEYRALIEERVATLSAPVENAESRLTRAANALAPLNADVLNRLAPRARELTREAAERLAAVVNAEAEVAEQEGRIADAVRRGQELADLRQCSLAALAEHARADRAVLDALSVPGAVHVDGVLDQELGRVRAALAEVDAQLEAVDQTLGRALTARAGQLRDSAAH